MEQENFKPVDATKMKDRLKAAAEMVNQFVAEYGIDNPINEAGCKGTDSIVGWRVRDYVRTSTLPQKLPSWKKLNVTPFNFMWYFVNFSSYGRAAMSYGLAEYFDVGGEETKIEDEKVHSGGFGSKSYVKVVDAIADELKNFGEENSVIVHPWKNECICLAVAIKKLVGLEQELDPKHINDLRATEFVGVRRLTLLAHRFVSVLDMKFENKSVTSQSLSDIYAAVCELLENPAHDRLLQEWYQAFAQNRHRYLTRSFAQRNISYGQEKSFEDWWEEWMEDIRLVERAGWSKKTRTVAPALVHSGPSVVGPNTARVIHDLQCVVDPIEEKKEYTHVAFFGHQSAILAHAFVEIRRTYSREICMRQFDKLESIVYQRKLNVMPTKHEKSPLFIFSSPAVFKCRYTDYENSTHSLFRHLISSGFYGDCVVTIDLTRITDPLLFVLGLYEVVPDNLLYFKIVHRQKSSPLIHLYATASIPDDAALNWKQLFVQLLTASESCYQLKGVNVARMFNQFGCGYLDSTPNAAMLFTGVIAAQRQLLKREYHDIIEEDCNAEYGVLLSAIPPENFKANYDDPQCRELPHFVLSDAPLLVKKIKEWCAGKCAKGGWLEQYNCMAMHFEDKPFLNSTS